MRTLTGLSGEYVIFDQTVRECIFIFEFLSTRKEHLTWKIIGFNGLATFFERLHKECRSKNAGILNF